MSASDRTAGITFAGNFFCFLDGDGGGFGSFGLGLLLTLVAALRAMLLSREVRLLCEFMAFVYKPLVIWGTERFCGL